MHNNQQHIKKFNELFEKHYSNITRLTQNKYQNQFNIDQTREYVHDAYISIIKTMQRGKKEYINFKEDKHYLNYIYYSINSFIYNKTKTENNIDKEFNLETIKTEPESLNGIDMFYLDTLKEMEELLNPFDFIIFNAIIVNGYTPNQVHKKTKIAVRKINESLEEINKVIQDNMETWKQFKNLYIVDNDFYQDDYEDCKKRNKVDEEDIL